MNSYKVMPATFLLLACGSEAPEPPPESAPMELREAICHNDIVCPRPPEDERPPVTDPAAETQACLQDYEDRYQRARRSEEESCPGDLLVVFECLAETDCDGFRAYQTLDNDRPCKEEAERYYQGNKCPIAI